MNDEAFRKLFQNLIEKTQLDPETAQMLWQRILEKLFPPPRDGPPSSGK